MRLETPSRPFAFGGGDGGAARDSGPLLGGVAAVRPGWVQLRRLLPAAPECLHEIGDGCALRPQCLDPVRLRGEQTALGIEHLQLTR